MRRRDLLRYALGVAVAGVSGRSLMAQPGYPERPIRLIVPRSAGGVLDIVARQWSDRVKTLLGSVVVENQGGGGGVIGTSMVAHSQPDGYTLLLGSTSDLVLSPLQSPLTPYRAKDFAPVATLAVSVAAIMVHASVPVHTLAELADYARAHPGALSYGSAGTGTMANLCGELFKSLAGTPDIVHVPYRGAAGGYADLVAGQVPMFASNVTDQIMELHRAGKIRVLAVASPRRLSIAPDIPTAAEAGYPDLVAELALGLFAPQGTSPEVVSRLAAVTREALDDPDFRSRLVQAGFEPVLGVGPQETAARLVQEAQRWQPVLKTTGMKTQ